MVADKMIRTKWYGQNGIGQNGIGQNGTDKMLRINHQSIPLSIDNMIFSSIPLPI